LSFHEEKGVELDCPPETCSKENAFNHLPNFVMSSSKLLSDGECFLIPITAIEGSIYNEMG